MSDGRVPRICLRIQQDPVSRGWRERGRERYLVTIVVEILFHIARPRPLSGSQVPSLTISKYFQPSNISTCNLSHPCHPITLHFSDPQSLICAEKVFLSQLRGDPFHWQVHRVGRQVRSTLFHKLTSSQTNNEQWENKSYLKPGVTEPGLGFTEHWVNLEEW